MGNTANNNWPYPESTDLVKDGATAIENLADAIDTTLGVYADPGLVLLNTTSFSAVASQSVNDVFSATYLSYLILIDYSGTIDGSGVGMKLRVSGSDATTNYNLQDNTINGTGVTASRATGGSGWDIHLAGNATRNLANIVLSSPFETRTTTGFATGSSCFSTIMQRNYYMNNTNATSYTGFTLTPGGGTITGSVSVYGYNK
jgi:hypothetical protein